MTSLISLNILNPTFKNNLEICTNNSDVFKLIKNHTTICHKLLTSKIAKNIQNFKKNLEYYFHMINSINSELNNIFITFQESRESQENKDDTMIELQNKIRKFYKNESLSNKDNIILKSDLLEINSFLDDLKKKIDIEKSKYEINIKKEIEELKLKKNNLQQNLKILQSEFMNIEKKQKEESLMKILKENILMANLKNEKINLENKLNEIEKEIESDKNKSEMLFFYPNKNFLILNYINEIKNNSLFFDVKIFEILDEYKLLFLIPGIKFINFTKTFKQLNLNDFNYNNDKTFHFIIILPESVYYIEENLKQILNFAKKYFKFNYDIIIITHNEIDQFLINKFPFHFLEFKDNFNLRKDLIKIANSYIDKKLINLINERETFRININKNEEVSKKSESNLISNYDNENNYNNEHKMIEKEIQEIKNKDNELNEMIQNKNSEIINFIPTDENKKLLEILNKLISYIKTHLVRISEFYEFIKVIDEIITEFLKMGNELEIIKIKNYEKYKIEIGEFLKLSRIEFANYESELNRMKVRT